MELLELVLKGDYAAGLPVYFRQLRSLAKIAHRGRHDTPCPAVAPLRFLSNGVPFVYQFTS